MTTGCVRAGAASNPFESMHEDNRRDHLLVDLLCTPSHTTHGKRSASLPPSDTVLLPTHTYAPPQFLALNAQRMASTLVACGPCVPERLYEARTLALSAVCLAWSPPYAAPRKQPQQHGVGPAAAAATTSSGSGRSQTEDQAGGPAAGGAVLARSCVLAVGNKLGQVSMWRMDMQAGPAEQRQQQLPGSGAKLQWLGMLAAAGGSNGSHVARLHWLVAPEEAAEAVDGVAGSLQGQWRVPQPNSAGPRDSLLLLTGAVAELGRCCMAHGWHHIPLISALLWTWFRAKACRWVRLRLPVPHPRCLPCRPSSSCPDAPWSCSQQRRLHYAVGRASGHLCPRLRHAATGHTVSRRRLGGQLP